MSGARLRLTAFLLPFSAALFSGCSWNSTVPGAETPASARIVVSVEDETDKAYLADVGDVSSLYRDIATKLSDSLSATGLAATAFDVAGARRLTVRLRRVSITNNSSGSNLDVYLRTQYSAEFEGWTETYDREGGVQNTVPGGSSPPVIRDLISSQVASELARDEDLLRALRK